MHAQIATEVPEIVDGLLSVLRASVPMGSAEGTFALDPAQRLMAGFSPCAAAMAMIRELAACDDDDAVLRSGADGAVLVRAAVALLRAAPAGAAAVGGALGVLQKGIVGPGEVLNFMMLRFGAPAAAAAAAPELAPLFSALDAAADALAGVVAAAARALRGSAGEAHAPRGGVGDANKHLMIEFPLESLTKMLKAAAAAAGAARPPAVTRATYRAVLDACVAVIALVPAGAGASHWAMTSGVHAYSFLVCGGAWALLRCGQGGRCTL